MHRASGFGARQVFLYLAPLVVLTVLGLAFGRTLIGSSGASLASAPFDGEPVTNTPRPGTPAPLTPAAPVAGAPAVTPMPNLGVKRGTFTLKGPKRATRGSFVVFVLEGPQRVLRTDATAPFAVKINSKRLPNGKYTASVLWVRKGKTSVASTHALRIDNPKRVAVPEPSPTAPGGDDDESGTADPVVPTSGRFAAQVLALTNSARREAGCKPLAENAKLAAAAQAHSEDMAEKDYFAHDSRDGRSPFDRIKDAGYSFGAAAENIAMGQQTPAAVMDAWMDSSGHRANILNCTYTQLGVGYAAGSGSPYWTQDFGKPR